MASRVAFLVWRDTAHPDGGGSELFVERVAEWLAEHGHDVTIVCAAHPNAPRDEVRAGVRYRRRGGRFSVYLHGLRYVIGRQGRSTEVIIDVQNGLPFWTPLVRRRGVVALVHHCHRQQWRILFPGLIAGVGSWLETRLAPWVYRRLPYITVSEASRADLLAQGIAPQRVQIVHNGVDLPLSAAVTAPACTPTLCVVGRLVPHKQVEHALSVVHALRPLLPQLRLDIVGDGWWADQLVARVDELGLQDAVTFHGFVSTARRDEIIAASWLMIMPSVKEGWGIVVLEAAALGVAAVAYRSAGGVTESITDQVTGVLVEDLADLTKVCEDLLGDPHRRENLGSAARERAAQFSWDQAGRAFARAAGIRT